MSDLEVGEYVLKWTIPKLRHVKENTNKTFEFYFNGEKVEMTVDLFVGKIRTGRDYFTKISPLVFFKEVPKKPCSFSMVIKSSYGPAVNIIEKQKMEANKSLKPYPERFMDSHNLKVCENRDETTIVIEITIMKDVDNSVNNNVSVQMKELFESKKLSDFTLVVDREKIKVHKAVLAARSKEFRRYFTQYPNKSTFNISDVSKEVFADFLLFIYTGRLQNLDTAALELLQLAKRFSIKSLMKICVAHLKLTLTEENASQIFQISHQQDFKELKKIAFQWVQQTFADAGKKIPASMINAPEKVGKLVDLMKSIDVILEIEQSLELIKTEVTKDGLDGSVEKTTFRQKRVSFAKKNKVQVFNEVEPKSDEDDEGSEDEVTDYLETAEGEDPDQKAEEEMRTQL